MHDSHLWQLTKREQQVLAGIAKGYTNAHIALNLGLSEKTVKNYVTTLYNKLGVDNRVQAARYVWEDELR